MCPFRPAFYVVALAWILLSGCATRNNTCPSFENGNGAGRAFKVKTYLKQTFKHRPSVHVSKKPIFPQTHTTLITKSYRLSKHALPLLPLQSDSVWLVYKPLNTVGYAKDVVTPPARETRLKMVHALVNPKLVVSKHTKSRLNAVSDHRTHKHDSISPSGSRRQLAISKGMAILVMAVTAGISIPVLGSLTASIGLSIIALLDIWIGLGVIKYYKHDKPAWAQISGGLRLLYACIFGIGIIYHIMGQVQVFSKFWSLGLIVFGLHLIALGIVFQNEGGKKWVNYLIKGLLIMAGVGYTFLNVGLLFASNPIAFTALIQPIFVGPQILAEVLFALWMIVKGGKPMNKPAVHT